MWAKWTSRASWTSLAPRPCIAPLRQLCTNRKLPQAAKRVVEHVVTMGAVTQTVLRSWGYSESSVCQACGQLGTPHHRFWLCPAHGRLREQCDWHYQHQGAIADADDMWYTRALVSEKHVPFAPTVEYVQWQNSSDQYPVFDHTACSDGSLMHKHRAGGQVRMGCCWMARRASNCGMGQHACKLASTQTHPTGRVVGHSSSLSALQPASNGPR